MGTQGLFILLSTLQYMQGMQGSALLDSLTCVNDYNTHWKCQWKISEEAHKLLPMDLIHWSETSSKYQSCEKVGSDEIKDGEIYMTCQINETFYYALTSQYTFQPRWNVSKTTHVHPNSNVQMSPPEGLIVQKSDLKNGSITLRWRMPDNISYHRSLLYQVTYYRKDWESWEDAAVLNVMGKTDVSLSPGLFVPGSTYLFRVRSVPDEEHRYRSAWSDSISWMMPEEEDRAILQNLHCEYDGLAQMKCSWEVRKELSSIFFMLYYKDGAGYGTTETSIHGENPCNNISSEIKDGTPYVLYSCTFHINSSQANSSFDIQVRPHVQKNFTAYEHIQTNPPTDLQIKDPLKYKYKLGWSPPEVPRSTMKLKYQLCYWKQGDDECPDLKLITVSSNALEYYIPSSELLSSTNYIAKVRAKPDIDSKYNGPWSDWSRSYSWKTDKEVNTVAISVASFVISVGVLLCIYLGFVCLKRFKQQWEDSIPDPRKSKQSRFLLGYRSTDFPQFISQDFYAEVEGSLVLLQISHIESRNSERDVSEEYEVETPSEPSESLLGPYSLPPPTAEEDQNLQAASTLPEIEGALDLKEASISQSTGHPSKMGCKSPNFIFTHAQFMSDLIPKESKSSEYFILPKCQSKVFSSPKEFIPTSQTICPGNQMSYVLSMEKNPPLQIPLKDNEDKHESKKSNYFAIPAPSEVQAAQQRPVMVINHDGTGPVVLKQVGDYCFFPGIQENLERKTAQATGKMSLQMPKGVALPAVQTFKAMQRDYIAFPQS
ncbi:cytokine receptor common subunit beta [Hyla sarda]|uniref:cytokine receptor common subunit beta n=1 Tax=Hyla sarda TaxID=327740 RepID=UPI0024C38B07|nr:cytokine receptor common subunit beta [Hyla sarda]XP_056380063.1 cytokine receptor common subunit beta [Hyla sarda]XP_056380064.1 cytokine receptor common subunit beta [Hyla sarda]XP_056380065.1 cytokine receptor common subunit beta [Hyla sarda]